MLITDLKRKGKFIMIQFYRSLINFHVFIKNNYKNITKKHSVIIQNVPKK